MTEAGSQNKPNDSSFSLVSVISPCFNNEKYLSAFLDSVLAQTYSPIELILVDDGSTDRTLEIAESYKDRFGEKKLNYILIHSEVNRGAAAAVNLGIPHIHGDYSMWADSDDILYPENIMEKVCYLKENPDKDFVLCQMISVNENDLETPVNVWKRTIKGDCDPLVEDLLLARNVVYGPGTIMVRRKAFEQAIPDQFIYESRQGQNYQLILPLAYCCKCGYIDKVLAKYVIHNDSHSNKVRSYEEGIRRQEEFIELIKETLKRIPGMKDADYARFMSLARQTLLNNELDLSLRYGHLLHYRQIRKEMEKSGLPVKRNLKPFFYYARRIKRYILSSTSRK